VPSETINPADRLTAADAVTARLDNASTALWYQSERTRYLATLERPSHCCAYAERSQRRAQLHIVVNSTGLRVAGLEAIADIRIPYLPGEGEIPHDWDCE
jgi:hypothetical protein